eukprot:TRINITY_DN368_c0_g1_i1.p1 TRINITY_DN368_c0_g1~~TRINITY_DN368_c0_g1_i1.p1  ORF type:complete len:233 (+),score=83.62 TRINITY_DN368_c0_g1_i1:30-728(+)
MEQFTLAGEVVKEFVSIGNVARAMVLQGMKEYTKNTFGEEALELFGEDGGSSIGGGSSRQSKVNLKWDTSKKGKDILVDGETISTKSVGGSWNGIYGTPKFEKGLHYVEIQTIQMDNNHFVFFGISDSTIQNFECCCAYGQTVTVGYSGGSRWKPNDHTSFLLDNRTSSVRIQFYVNGEPGGWKSTTYTDTTNIVLFICLANDINIKLTNYSGGEKKIKEYFKKKYNKNIDI